MEKDCGNCRYKYLRSGGSDCSDVVGVCVSHSKWASEVREPIEEEVLSIDPKSSYYDRGGIETIKAIKAKVPDFLSYLQGNVIKYATRAPYKQDARRDVEKIITYAKMWLDELPEEPF